MIGSFGGLSTRPAPMLELTPRQHDLILCTGGPLGLYPEGLMKGCLMHNLERRLR